MSFSVNVEHTCPECQTELFFEHEVEDVVNTEFKEKAEILCWTHNKTQSDRMLIGRLFHSLGILRFYLSDDDLISGEDLSFLLDRIEELFGGRHNATDAECNTFLEENEENPCEV